MKHNGMGSGPAYRAHIFHFKTQKHFMGLFDILSKKTEVQYFTEAINFINIGQYSKAIASYDKAIAIEPDYTDAWINRGNILEEHGRDTEATESYGKAIAINQNYAEVWSNRGWALGELGQHAEALVSFNKAIVINPYDAIAKQNRETALKKLKKI